MATSTFLSCYGESLGVATISGVKHFLTDALGSVVATMETSGVGHHSDYKPFGATGAQPPTAGCGYLGSKGVRSSGRSFAELYARMRHRSTLITSWTTPEPSSLEEPIYAYCNGSPIANYDADGLKPVGPAGSGQGSNFGKCAVYSCNQYSGIFHDSLIPSHRYTCVSGPSGGCSGGLYGQALPGRGRVENLDYSCSSSDDGVSRVVCTQISSGDCGIASNICACNKDFVSNPPLYIFPVQACYSYPRSLFDCACNKLTGVAQKHCWFTAELNV
jgi:hypothetical protein